MSEHRDHQWANTGLLGILILMNANVFQDQPIVYIGVVIGGFAVGGLAIKAAVDFRRSNLTKEGA